MVVMSACAGGITSSNSKNELSEPYRLALDELITTDKALNAGMEYISLDFSKEIPIKDSEKKVIQNYLEDQYDVKVYNLTLEQLIEKKLYDKTESNLKGILLKVEKQEQIAGNDQIAIEVSKYRSNMGALTSMITLTYEKGSWEVTKHIPMSES